MLEESITKSIKRYLNEINNNGIPVNCGIIFGSFANNNNSKWSDIDLLVLSSYFDSEYKRKDINLLWKIAARIDNRIEPIPIGLNRWNKDDESTIIEIARREGIKIFI